MTAQTARPDLHIPDVAPHSAGDELPLIASEYGAAGLYVVAVHGKNPGITGTEWQTRSVTGGPDAYELLSSRPAATGVGLHVGRSGLVEIDVDVEDESLVPPEIMRAIRELKPPHFTTRIDAQLRGGYLFRSPPGRRIGNSLGKLAPPVGGQKWGDIRGTNGMCVLPGSAHPEPDGEYAWQHTGPVPELPAYLAEMLPDGDADAAGSADAPTVTAFLAEHVSTLQPGALQACLSTYDKHAPSGRHTAASVALCMAMREARAGLYPAGEANRALRAQFTATIRGERDVTGEWMGLLSWAVGQALSAPDDRLAEIRERSAAVTGGVVDTETGQLLPALILPSPSQPARVAEVIATEHFPRDPGGATAAAWWRDDFYRWVGTHWQVWPRPEIEGYLYRTTYAARWFKPANEDDDFAEAMTRAQGGDDEAGRFRPWNPTQRSIAEVMNSLAKQWLQRVGDDTRVLACENGVVDLADPAKPTLLPHSAARFNLTALDFAYDPQATCPRWLAFLDSALPGDVEAQQFLGEWCGYVLSGDTSQQKIASLIGRPRSGKGTIIRTLESLLGDGASVAVDITELGQQFGRASLVGKSLATMSDVRWNSHLATEALKCLLAVSGEDSVTWSRKHRDDWSGRSGVRFLVASNDVPTFADRSNAIGKRMIHVAFGQSFAGREDHGLERKLREERAGILNWALAGLRRLRERGRFIQPESGKIIGEEMERNANPVGQFVEERCELGAERGVSAEELLAAYTAWARGQGMDRSMHMRTFLTALRQAADGIGTVRRAGPTGGKRQYVTGAALAGWHGATVEG